LSAKTQEPSHNSHEDFGEPLLSVIVPVYNGADKLEKALSNIQHKIDQLYDSAWAMEMERSRIEHSLLTTGDFPHDDPVAVADNGIVQRVAMDTNGRFISQGPASPEHSAQPAHPHWKDWYEIIVVNDGSLDKTLNVIEKIRKHDHRILCVSYRINKGKGHAIKKGVLRSTGKYIMFMDGDGDISADILVKYVQKLSKAHIVIGSKNHKNSVVKAPFTRRFLSKCFQMYAKVLLGLKVGDTQVGLKAGRGDVFRKIFEQVQVDRYAFDTEMLAIAGLMDVKVVELPVKIKLDKSFKKKEIIRMAIDVLGVAFRLRVKKSYQEVIDERPRPSIPTVAEA
jgi:glycosyltransferase involved in cell wall biosynthesis